MINLIFFRYNHRWTAANWFSFDFSPMHKSQTSFTSTLEFHSVDVTESKSIWRFRVSLSSDQFTYFDVRQTTTINCQEDENKLVIYTILWSLVQFICLHYHHVSMKSCNNNRQLTNKTRQFLRIRMYTDFLKGEISFFFVIFLSVYFQVLENSAIVYV